MSLNVEFLLKLTKKNKKENENSYFNMYCEQLNGGVLAPVNDET